MARRRRGFGWLVLLVAIGGMVSLLTHHDPPPPPAAVDAVAQPLATPQPLPASSSATRLQLASPTVMYVTSTSLNVRATPSTTGTPLLNAPRGTAVIAVSTQDGWVEVRLNSGSTGWMNATYLSTSVPLAPKASRSVSSQIAQQAPAPAFDRAQVLQAIIAESIASYSGSCPCPYNTDRAGHSCGRRSAYSKPGGASPICYEQDVTQSMIDAYLARKR